MKNLIIICSILIFTFTSIFAQEKIYISFNQEKVDKYQYKVDGLSNYEYHNAYHVNTLNGDKFILNTSIQSFEFLKPSVTVTSVDKINWYTTLLNEVNLGLTELYIVEEKKDISFAYRVSTAIFAKETSNQIMYSGPYYSFNYEKKKNYEINDKLEYGEFIIHNEANFINYGKDKIECLDNFMFKKKTFEKFPKESYTMIATTDFDGILTEDSVKSVERTTYIKFVSSIGIVEEITYFGAIRLISINGENIDSYISKICSSSTPESESSITHVVDNGETLYSISKKYDVSISDIQMLNNLDGTEIEVTQLLIIKK